MSDYDEYEDIIQEERYELLIEELEETNDIISKRAEDMENEVKRLQEILLKAKRKARLIRVSPGATQFIRNKATELLDILSEIYLKKN